MNNLFRVNWRTAIAGACLLLTCIGVLIHAISADAAVSLIAAIAGTGFITAQDANNSEDVKQNQALYDLEDKTRTPHK